MKKFGSMEQSRRKIIKNRFDKTKTNAFKTIQRTILTFGCELWVMHRKQERKIQVVYLKHHRRGKEKHKCKKRFKNN